MNRPEPAEEFWEMDGDVMVRFYGCLFVHVLEPTKIAEKGRRVFVDVFFRYTQGACYIDSSHQLHVVVEHLTFSHTYIIMSPLVYECEHEMDGCRHSPFVCAELSM